MRTDTEIVAITNEILAEKDYFDTLEGGRQLDVEAVNHNIRMCIFETVIIVDSICTEFEAYKARKDAIVVNISEKTEQLADFIADNYGRFTATHEFQDMIFVRRQDFPDVHFDFGHNNETWGASITSPDGADLGYIDTDYSFADTPIEILAERMAFQIDDFLTHYKPITDQDAPTNTVNPRVFDMRDIFSQYGYSIEQALKEFGQAIQDYGEVQSEMADSDQMADEMRKGFARIGGEIADMSERANILEDLVNAQPKPQPSQKAVTAVLDVFKHLYTGGMIKDGNYLTFEKQIELARELDRIGVIAKSE